MTDILIKIGGFISEYALFVTIYLVIINILTLSTYIADKKKAIKGEWRVPEKVLILLAFLGGALGALIGMYGIRHKTKHIKFIILVPTAFVFYTVLILSSTILYSLH